MPRPTETTIVEQGMYPAYQGIVVWSVLMVLNRYAVTVLDVNPWSLALVQMLAGGLGLLVVAGPGVGNRRTLWHGYTWAIGALRLVSALLHILALVLISATEAQFIIQFSMLLSLVMAWMFLGRRPALLEIPGVLLILVGLVWLISRAELGWGNPAIWLLVGTAFCFSLQSLLSELHPESNKALSLKARARYTGIVMIVTSLTFLIGFILLSWLGEVHPDWLDSFPPLNETIAKVPGLESFLDPITLVLAAAVGLVVRSPAMYLSFLSIRYIKSENHVMIMSAMPFTIMGLESIVGLLAPMDTSMLDAGVVLAGSMITAGAVYMVFIRASRSMASRMERERREHLRDAGGD